MQIIENLADGRNVFSVRRRDLPALQIGQWLRHEKGGDFALDNAVIENALNKQPVADYPVMRLTNDEAWVVAHAPIDLKHLSVSGDPIELPMVISEPFALVTENDGFFRLLAWLFAHRKTLPPQTRAFFQFDGALPFRPQPSKFLTPDFPAHVTGAIPLIDDWNISHRIFHAEGHPGCMDDRILWQELIGQCPQRLLLI